VLSKNKESGFTLLETMIAMAIMMVAFASILMVQSSSINTVDKARQNTTVAMLARSKMIETESEIEGKKFSEIKEEETGTFKEPFQDYSWKREVKEIKFPNLNFKSPSTSGDGNSGGSADADSGTDQVAELMAKLVSQYLSKALREVRLTILWKRGSGTQNFTVAMYWVDLDTQFELQ
jgi:general secretion pathway protein I